MSHLGVGKVKTASIRYRYLLLFAAVFGGSLLLLIFSNHLEVLLLSTTPAAPSWYLHRSQIAGSDESFTIKTEGCTIPGLQPFDDTIEKFISRPRNLNQCSNASISLLQNNDTHIWINSGMMQFYDIPRDGNVSCCYNSFFRPSAIVDTSTVYIDDRVIYQPCLYFSDYIEVDHEFIRVSCFSDFKLLYEQFLVFPSKNPVLITRENLTETRQNKTSYNVIIIGVDAVSRLNFHRTMPKTLHYLKKKGAIELFGYNKVGDNTFPNLTPMLLGIKDTDLQRTCWPNARATFDGCPFIWKWFKEAGYYTALGEDSANLGTFNYLRIGFNDTPTDYYLHTFMHEAENHVGNNKRLNTFLCMGDKYFYKVLLDYIASLTSTLRSSKLFGFFWEVTMSHDFLNYPMLMDESYEFFLKKLDKINYLDNTILILLSDHGIRWGDIRMTKQGRLEERLPFVHIMVPPSFRETYNVAYDNLKLNSKRLTTPFDIYSTLADLVDLDAITNERLKSRAEASYSDRRGISLFLPIPGNRTCEAAAIEDQWCTCHSGNRLSIDSEKSREVSGQLVSHLNALLRSYRQCAHLKLGEILEVTEMVVGTPRENEVGWREFMAVVRTQPGAGVFEGTLRHDGRRWALAGAVSRLNLYGDQSRCMYHYELKLYCYCT